MITMFRPLDKNKAAQIKMRRLGASKNFNFCDRVKWYPAGWRFNKQVLGTMHGRMHYLACHAPKPVQKAWRAKYDLFMRRHFGDHRRASMRYFNTWSCHSWM